MQITLNGESTPIDKIQTVNALIDHLQIEGKIAVEINQEIIPKSQFSSFTIKDGDIIEIVHAIGGG